MTEEWRPVNGYLGYYEVSNLGKVRSVDRYVNNHKADKAFRVGQEMKQATTEHGYKKVSLRMGDSKSSYRVHRLVAEAFIPNPYNKKQVNHKDSNRQNNSVENLEWATHKENMKHAKDNSRFINQSKGSNHHKATITEDTVRSMRKAYAEGKYTQKQIAEKFGVHLSKAKHILAGRTWKHVA